MARNGFMRLQKNLADKFTYFSVEYKFIYIKLLWIKIFTRSWFFYFAVW